MEAHVARFEVERERQATIAAHADSQDKIDESLRKQELRRIQINKLQRNAGFMEEWQ
jgi:hypothetical protein